MLFNILNVENSYKLNILNYRIITDSHYERGSYLKGRSFSNNIYIDSPLGSRIKEIEASIRKDDNLLIKINNKELFRTNNNLYSYCNDWDITYKYHFNTDLFINGKNIITLTVYNQNQDESSDYDQMLYYVTLKLIYE